ncbi:MAG: helix-turn-helix domain-containing protein [Candidatus Cryptobacteroides sp.]
MESGNEVGQPEQERSNLAFLKELLFGHEGFKNVASVSRKSGVPAYSINYWLKKDNASLSNVTRLLDALGYGLKIEYTIPGFDRSVSSIRSRILDPKRQTDVTDSPLGFLRALLRELDISAMDLSLALGYTKNTVYWWFKKEDVDIANIVRIAETLNIEVKFEITEGRQGQLRP